MERKEWGRQGLQRENQAKTNRRRSKKKRIRIKKQTNFPRKNKTTVKRCISKEVEWIQPGNAGSWTILEETGTWPINFAKPIIQKKVEAKWIFIRFGDANGG